MERMDGLIQLNGGNYQRWKFELMAVLESKECLDIVLGNETKPVPTETTALRSWKKNDALARSIISKSLDDDHHSFIRSCTSSHEMWTSLVVIKEATTSSNKLLTSQEFHAYRRESGMTVSSFLSGLNVIVQKLETLSMTTLSVHNFTNDGCIIRRL